MPPHRRAGFGDFRTSHLASAWLNRSVPSGRINLYRFVADAWAGGLQEWCHAGTEDSAMESWVLLENAGQARWLNRLLEEEGLGGIRMFDAEGLRDELARLAGMGSMRGMQADRCRPHRAC